MKTFQDPKEKTEQIMRGLDLAYRRLIEYKKSLLSGKLFLKPGGNY